HLFLCFLIALFSRWDIFFLYFFFSSRRRHTRFSRDWSSDVCSSDLDPQLLRPVQLGARALPRHHVVGLLRHAAAYLGSQGLQPRSEERRVGKECRSRGAPYRQKERERSDCVRERSTEVPSDRGEGWC